MQFLTSAQFGKFPCMRSAVSGARQPRITSASFVNLFAFKTGKPRLDPPSGNEYRHQVIVGTGIDTLLDAFFIKLPNSVFDTHVVPIDHYGKPALNPVPATTISRQLLREVDPYVAFARYLSARCKFSSELSLVPTQFDKEPCHERRMLLIFA